MQRRSVFRVRAEPRLTVRVGCDGVCQQLHRLLRSLLPGSVVDGENPVLRRMEQEAFVAVHKKLRVRAHLRAVQRDRLGDRPVRVHAFQREALCECFAVPPEAADKTPETAVRAKRRGGNCGVPRTIKRGLITKIGFLLRFQIILDDLRRNDAVLADQEQPVCVASGRYRIDEISVCGQNSVHPVSRKRQLRIDVGACVLCAYEIGAGCKDGPCLPRNGIGLCRRYICGAFLLRFPAASAERQHK